MATLFEKLWKISVLEGYPLCKDHYDDVTSTKCPVSTNRCTNAFTLSLTNSTYFLPSEWIVFVSF